AWNLASTNWNNGETYTDGKNVLIAPTENIEVDITESVQPVAVVVKGDADVTLKGTGSIAGAASLNKAGSGSLVVETPQSYEGATVLHDGTYEFSSIANGGVPSGIGASMEFAQNWIWAGGTYKYTGASASTNRSATLEGNTTFNIVNKAAALSMSGSLAGAGNLTVDGEGQITVNSTEFFKYDGNLIMKGGKVLLNGELVSKAGLGTVSKLVMAGGTFATNSTNDKNPTYTFPIEATDDTYSYVSFFRNCLIKSAVSGSGTLEWEVNWVREYIEGDWSKFTGRVVVNGTGSAGNSQFAVRNGNGIQNGTFTLKGKAQIVGGKNQSTYYLGGLSGAAGTFLSGFDVKNAGSGTWIVGSANTDETFAGVIDGRCQGGKDGTTSIEKVGSGDWRLTGKNIYKGTTQIRGGRLVVNGNNSGTGSYTVNANATLAGKGTVGGAVSVKSEGIVFAGDTLIDGSTLTLAKTLNVA
ncbi:MAG: autotransporter-associated beta strand repeat-containing protein, partial [Prevotella sp.]|nr:autotransporter-associated beta strand repeat-containing protein [Prevotella sp.]